MGKFVYLDHAATTPARPEVVEAMLPYFTEKFWNPSSVYSPAAENKQVIDQCREQIAQTLGTEGKNIYFTAGGSEADNWALKPMRAKGNILLQVRLNIMRFFIHAIIWSPKALKSHILTWMKMES